MQTCPIKILHSYWHGWMALMAMSPKKGGKEDVTKLLFGMYTNMDNFAVQIIQWIFIPPFKVRVIIFTKGPRTLTLSVPSKKLCSLAMPRALQSKINRSTQYSSSQTGKFWTHHFIGMVFCILLKASYREVGRFRFILLNADPSLLFTHWHVDRLQRTNFLIQHLHEAAGLIQI